MRQINLLLMPEDIQLCEKTKVKPVVMKPSEMGKTPKEEETPTPVEPTEPIDEPVEPTEPVDPTEPTPDIPPVENPEEGGETGEEPTE